MTNTEYKKFYIVKSWVDSKLSHQQQHIPKRDIQRSVENVGTRAKILSELLIEEIERHNSSIQAKRTRLENLKYKDHRTYQSKLIIGHNVPFRTIDKLIKENPDLEEYDIWKILRDKYLNL